MIEHVTRTLSFDNLVVDVSVYRYICNDCGKRECFPDAPMPYPEPAPQPWERGWRLQTAVGDEAEQGCLCRQCSEAKDALAALRTIGETR